MNLLSSISLSPATFVILGVIIVLLVKKNTSKERYINIIAFITAFELFWVQGFFMTIGGQRPVFDYLLCALVLVVSFFILIRQKMEKRLFLFCLLLLIVAVLGVVFQYFDPTEMLVIASEENSYSGDIYASNWDNYIINPNVKREARISDQSLIGIIRVTAFIFFIMISRNWFDKKDYISLSLKISKIAKFHVIYALTEFITKNLFNSNMTNNLNNWLFGVGGSTITKLSYRDGRIVLQGFTREGSHLAWSLMIIGIFIIFEYYLTKKKSSIFFLILIGFLYVNSPAFVTLYDGLILVLFIWQLAVLQKQSNMTKKAASFRNAVTFITILFAGILTIIIMYNIPTWFPNFRYAGRISNSFYQLELMIKNEWTHGTFAVSGGSNSEIARFVSIFDTWRVFLERPLIGIGLSVAGSHGAVTAMLADIGALGMILWYKCITHGYKFRNNALLLLILLTIAPNLLAGRSGYAFLLFSGILPVMISMFSTTPLNELQKLVIVKSGRKKLIPVWHKRRSF